MLDTLSQHFDRLKTAALLTFMLLVCQQLSISYQPLLTQINTNTQVNTNDGIILDNTVAMTGQIHQTEPSPDRVR